MQIEGTSERKWNVREKGQFKEINFSNAWDVTVATQDSRFKDLLK